MELTESKAAKFDIGSMRLNDRVSANMVSTGAWNSGSTAALFQSYGNYCMPLSWYHTHDSFKEAFKIVSLLIEKGYLKNITLRKFIQIVTEVENEL